jgi:catechol 2,3-dioxygenase-like lactoylglutathione lyase family enzyme
MRFEATPIPVSDFDRAKAFYQRLGWRLDFEIQVTDQLRAVQFTPPGSPASIQFGPAGPAPLPRLVLVVDGITAARAELVERGIEVGEIWHATPGQTPQPGRDPEGRPYASQAVFTDPDRNRWVLREITERPRGKPRAVRACGVRVGDPGDPRTQRLAAAARCPGRSRCVVRHLLAARAGPRRAAGRCDGQPRVCGPDPPLPRPGAQHGPGAPPGRCDLGPP